MFLSDLKEGAKGSIKRVHGDGEFRRRLMEMGFVRGEDVVVLQKAPFRDPIHLKIKGYELALRKKDAKFVEIESLQQLADSEHEITVALVGNPNSGKTTIFNKISGLNEKVGNYSGVTIAPKEALCKYNGHNIKVVDLPGTYSLSSYSPEEKEVLTFLLMERPDVVINVVDGTNLDRNLYLTLQLRELGIDTILALNMYDEVEKSGKKINIDSLSQRYGIRIVPTIGRSGEGIDNLFAEVVKKKSSRDLHFSLKYDAGVEKEILSYLADKDFKRFLSNSGMIYNSDLELSESRFLAISFIDGGEKFIELFGYENNDANYLSNNLLEKRRATVSKIESMHEEDITSLVTHSRYEFIKDSLVKAISESGQLGDPLTKYIDRVLTNKYLGFPIFAFFIWIMFQSTFYIGAYPMDWIESLIGFTSNFLGNNMSDGMFKDLLIDGIIGGVGGVIVFLPNILILYFFISLMEDTGYMARAAFIMDRLMSSIGLQGKSFIPIIMGFGCNVPAIMATRTIESRNSRMVTMLINPLISCSARLPVYLILVGAFFTANAGLVILGIYFFGMFLAAIMAKIFKNFLFTGEEVPFIIEMPPYRVPTSLSVVVMMWSRAKQYLTKMGGVILIASVVIWGLSYFPRQEIIKGVEVTKVTQQENSYIGKIGRAIEPIIKPLGFDWKIGVSLVTGMAAKEVVVSTMSVLYPSELGTDEGTLSERLVNYKNADGEPAFTPLIALSLILFVLIYFPCIASIVAITKESGSWIWGAFTVLYTTGLAWMVSFLVFQIGSFLLG